MNKIRQIAKLVEWEAFLWIVGLVFLLFINPFETSHVSLCPYKNLGIDFCPGCGVGRSISFFYHGELMHSLQTHPLGIIAFVLILARVIHLIRKKYFKTKQREVMYG